MTNPNGRFGIHGGQYIPETLMNAVIELEEAYNRCKNDPEFNRELTELLNEYAGRPSRLYYAEKMTRDLGGAKIYLKREDLNHTGAHKINNVLGQALLAKKMGKTRLIAETGAGQHGVATATAAALMGMECVVFMGEEDTVRQAMALCGALGALYGVPYGAADAAPSIDWGDGVLYDRARVWAEQREMVDAGLLRPALALAWYFDLPCETEAELAEIRRRFIGAERQKGGEA